MIQVQKQMLVGTQVLHTHLCKINFGVKIWGRPLSLLLDTPIIPLKTYFKLDNMKVVESQVVLILSLPP